LRTAALERARGKAGVVGAVDAADPAGRVPVAQESASWLVRTAMCFEPRDGRMHVFFPPLEKLEEYLELAALVEQTAADLGIPVLLEGSPPPFDPRLNVFKVTPDPGVIEVNLQPAHSWKELVHNTQTVYDEARLCRLGTEKFMVDGRHTGTGGGNHIIMGGATPSDSPILRRPEPSVAQLPVQRSVHRADEPASAGG
jgi:uncharacterized protein (DUF2126 family)